LPKTDLIKHLNFHRRLFPKDIRKMGTIVLHDKDDKGVHFLTIQDLFRRCGTPGQVKPKPKEAQDSYDNARKGGKIALQNEASQDDHCIVWIDSQNANQVLFAFSSDGSTLALIKIICDSLCKARAFLTNWYLEKRQEDLEPCMIEIGPSSGDDTIRVIKAIQKLTGPWQIGDWEFATEYLNKVQKQQMMAAAARPWRDSGSIAWIDPIMNFRVYHATMNKGSIAVRYQDTGSKEDAKSVLKAVLEKEIDCSTVNVVRRGDEEFQICSVTPESLESQLAAASLSKDPAKKIKLETTTRSKTQPSSARGSLRRNPVANAGITPEGPSEPSSPTDQSPQIPWDDHWQSFTKAAWLDEACMTISKNGKTFKLAWIGRGAEETQVYSAEGSIGSEADNKKCYQRYSGDEETAKTKFDSVSDNFRSDPGFYPTVLEIRNGRVEVEERSSNARMSTRESAGSTSKTRAASRIPSGANRKPTSTPGLSKVMSSTREKTVRTTTF
jgi:hypothetical protein